MALAVAALTGLAAGVIAHDRAEDTLVARIFAIADVFDALCSRRPYKEPVPLPQALEALREQAGRHFSL